MRAVSNYIEATITMLTYQVGGRPMPISPVGEQYRPRLVSLESKDRLEVAFVAGPALIRPGETANVTMRCLSEFEEPNPLQPNRQFLVVEEPRVVAVGKVIRIWSA